MERCWPDTCGTLATGAAIVEEFVVVLLPPLLLGQLMTQLLPCCTSVYVWGMLVLAGVVMGSWKIITKKIKLFQLFKKSLNKFNK